MPNQLQNELYHYGVKGMKWGVRRSRSDQIKALTEKARDIRETKGAASKKFISTRKKLYRVRNQEKLKEARANKDSVGIANAKANLAFSRRTRKRGGLANYMSGPIREILGNLSKREMEAATYVEGRSDIVRQRTNRVLRVVGAVAISSLATAEIKYYPRNG